MRLDKEESRQYGIQYRKTPRGFFVGLRARAKRRGIKVEISPEEFVAWFNSQELRCYYCDNRLEFPVLEPRKVQGLHDLVVDRKDNSIGYTIDNIVLACSRCNIVKGSWFTEKQMLKIGQIIHEEEK